MERPPRRRPWRSATLAIAVGLLPLAAQAAGVGALTLDADEAVWNQPLGFTVRGTSCDPAALGTPVLAAPGVISVPVEVSCPPLLDPPPEAPFELRGELRGFQPGTYVVHATDGGITPDQPLRLFPAGDALLELPEARSDDPSPVALVFLGSSCELIDWQLEGNVVRIDIGPCLIEPTLPRVLRFPLELGPLAAGTYSVRVYQIGEAGTTLVAGTLRVRGPGRCLPAADRLCLQAGRFAVSGQWQAFDGSTGSVHPLPLAGNEESGLLWFFTPDNAELTVKVLDGCGVNGRWWAFLSSASTVQYEITVTDIVTGATRAYRNELGQVPSLVADTALEACP